ALCGSAVSFSTLPPAAYPCQKLTRAPVMRNAPEVFLKRTLRVVQHSFPRVQHSPSSVGLRRCNRVHEPDALTDADYPELSARRGHGRQPFLTVLQCNDYPRIDHTPLHSHCPLRHSECAALLYFAKFLVKDSNRVALGPFKLGPAEPGPIETYYSAN